MAAAADLAFAFRDLGPALRAGARGRRSSSRSARRGCSSGRSPRARRSTCSPPPTPSFADDAVTSRRMPRRFADVATRPGGSSSIAPRGRGAHAPGASPTSTDSGLAKIAIANPEHAPYGRAAQRGDEARRGLGRGLAEASCTARTCSRRCSSRSRATPTRDRRALARHRHAGHMDARSRPSCTTRIDQAMVACTRGRAGPTSGRRFIDVRALRGGARRDAQVRVPLAGRGEYVLAAGDRPDDSRRSFSRSRSRWSRRRVAAVVGVALAALLANARFPGRDSLDVVVTAPIVLPPTVLGYYVLVALGRRSVHRRTRSRRSPARRSSSRAPARSSRRRVGALPLVVKSARAALEDVDPTLVRRRAHARRRRRCARSSRCSCRSRRAASSPRSCSRSRARSATSASR